MDGGGTTIEFGGTSRVTSAVAATVVLAPTVTPRRTVLRAHNERRPRNDGGVVELEGRGVPVVTAGADVGLLLGDAEIVVAEGDVIEVVQFDIGADPELSPMARFPRPLDANPVPDQDTVADHGRRSCATARDAPVGAPHPRKISPELQPREFGDDTASLVRPRAARAQGSVRDRSGRQRFQISHPGPASHRDPRLSFLPTTMMRPRGDGDTVRDDGD